MNRWRDDQFWLALALGPIVWGVSLGLTHGVRHEPPAWWVLALAVLVYPPLEEIVFRGTLQPWLAQRTGRRWGGVTAANLLASLAFAASHLLRHDWLHALLVLPPSLVFGYFYERHRGLASPIMIHAFYNAGYVYFLS